MPGLEYDLGMRGFVLFLILGLSSLSSAIRNGEPLLDQARPVVVRLYSVHKDESFSLGTLRSVYVNWCSAVAISDQVLLTAGHCLFPENSDVRLQPYAVQYQSDGKPRTVKALDFWTSYRRESSAFPYDPETAYHPDYVKGCRPGPVPLVNSPEPDVALVQFPPGTFQAWWPVDLESSVQIGEAIEYFGFGFTKDSFTVTPMGPDVENGALRRATNQVVRESPQRIAFWNPPESSWADSGDSGGPILRKGRVVAIMATRHEKCETQFGEDYKIMNTATRVREFWLKLPEDIRHRFQSLAPSLR
ncbi:MAG: trypsin-like serine peptidase [Bdellovibrionales bacterium]